MQIFGKTNFNFLAKRKLFLMLSIVIAFVGAGLTALIGLDYGIDFDGGTELAVSFEKPIVTDRIREAVQNIGIEGAEIKSFGENNQYIIRIKQSANTPKEIGESIDNAIPDIKMTVLKMDQIGPKIGGELKIQAIIAIVLSLVVLLIYIAFRFEFIFGLGAVIAILHDIIATFSVALIIHDLGLINMEINQSFIAAMLTVIGYSINNTVIIFDRVRENREVMKGKQMINIVNSSINETLSRTIITVFTVLIVLVILIFFGGPVLQPFAVLMTLGTIFGVYSSIYVSSSFVVWFFERKSPAISK